MGTLREKAKRLLDMTWIRQPWSSDMYAGSNDLIMATVAARVLMVPLGAQKYWKE
jgi:hypothetical protein